MLEMLAQHTSPSDVLFRMAVGCRNNQMIYVVAKLGIADLLVNRPVASSELASKLGVHARSLYRVMRALAAQGVFTQDSSNRFGLTPMSELLRSDNPATMRHVAIFFGEEYYRAAGELLHTVKTGETAFDHVYGKGHFDYPLEKYGFKDGDVVVDVGGGRGGLIAHILRSNPSLKGILYDLPQGVAEAAARLKSEGVADRCRIVTGSFFDSIPSGGDVYVMSRVLHDWRDEKAAIILANCHEAMANRGTLLVRDAVIPEGDTPHQGKQTDITMLFEVGGVERTEAEWRILLQQAKFVPGRVITTGQAFDLIEAKPA